MTAEGPRISETARDAKNGFHIRNQRGRFSQNRISEQKIVIIFFLSVWPFCIGDNKPIWPLICQGKNSLRLGTPIRYAWAWLVLALCQI